MTDYERMNAGDGFEADGAEAAGTEGETSGGKGSAQIEREIEQTRARMSERIDTISEKLHPSNLALSAVESVGVQARQTGSRVAHVIRENAIPVAAVGLGVTWLVAQRRAKSAAWGDWTAREAYRGPERRISGYAERRRRPGEARERVSGGVTGVADRLGGVAPPLGDVAERAQERVSELGSEARERVQELGIRSREQARRVRTDLERMIEKNPLAVAAGAGVLGLALGLLLPHTRREDRVMGPARDQLLDRAGETVERVKEAAAEAAQEVTETVKGEVADRGPELKGVVQGMAQRVTEQAKESAARVRDEAKDAVKEQTSEEKEQAAGPKG
jgi:ElaB/YqjD/DUF883 family membrane-anchored ribosome-binding protein